MNQEVFLGQVVAEVLLDADMTSTQMRGSTNDHPPVQAAGNTQEKTVGKQQDSKKNKVKDEINKTVPFHKLFSFARPWDCFLMLVGTISAVATGISSSLMAILAGDMVDAFGGHAGDKQVVDEVSKVMLSLIINVVKYLLERK